MIRIVVEKESCLSSGCCITAEPEVFRFDSDHLAEVIPDAPSLDGERARAVARACPASCILLYGPDGEEIDWEAGA